MGIAPGKYHIWTVGCQMNQADSQRVSAMLDNLGWESAPAMEDANLIILNTCSVREAPELRAHGQLSLLKRAKANRPDLLVSMMGCMIGNQRTIDDLKKRYPVVDLFFKVEYADILPKFLEERWTPIAAGLGCLDVVEQAGEQASTLLPIISAPVAITPKPATREIHYPGEIAQNRKATAWLPVILGCNKVCSYCVVPSRRGIERSRPVDELLREAQTLTDTGAREITLLGQTVEAYGLDLPGAPTLSQLMAQLSDIQNLDRIRFMTSYPRHFTDQMIHEMAALPKVCEHVNIPVQHGSDAVLQRMRRGYDIAEYKTLIEKLRNWWPGVTLSTDVIVGFCGETEDEFQELLLLLEEIRFDVVHVAMYSPRQGTLSNKWEDDIPYALKKTRLREVEIIQEKISLEINAEYVGSEQEILIEERKVQEKGVFWKGRTRSNKLLFMQADQTAGILAPGDLVVAKTDRASAWSLQGTYLRHAQEHAAAR